MQFIRHRVTHMVGVCAGSQAGIFYSHMEFLIRCIRTDNEKDTLFVEELHEFREVLQTEKYLRGWHGRGRFWAMRRAKECPGAPTVRLVGGITARS